MMCSSKGTRIVGSRLWLALGLLLPALACAKSQPIAIVNATLIDGTGGAPLSNATLLIEGKRISAIGPSADFKVPRNATVIDATGKFVTPGFIDSNVHISLYAGEEPLLWYEEKYNDIVLEGAQINLKYGITTIRDSYGYLPPLLHTRDAINKGEVVGPRLLVAGNIVGWGGPFAPSTFTESKPLTYFQEQMDDLYAQGVGEELSHMTVEEVRVAINHYLDKGPDFIKFGGTTHDHRQSWIQFSPRVQEAIVEETHKRGRVAETHSTGPEGLRLSVLAGIDLIQHPEVHMVEIPDDLVQLIVERGVICSILANSFIGEGWDKALEKEKKDQEGPQPPKTSWQRRNDLFSNLAPLKFKNAQKLIKAGCTVAVSTDSMLPMSAKFSRPNPEWDDKLTEYSPGYGTLRAIEGLVKLGMTPMQAIVSSTKNGALAARGLKDFGTLEVGKLADLVILDADPLADIANVHKQHLVMKEGRVIDRDSLPLNPVLSKKPMPAKQ